RREKGKRVLVVLMSVFFHPGPPWPQFKEKPRLPKRTGLQVGQSETLAVSGLTWNVAFGPRGFVLPFQISRLPKRCCRSHRVAAQRHSAHTPHRISLRDSMLGSCCACAKEAPAPSAVTARRALPVELGWTGTTTET